MEVHGERQGIINYNSRDLQKNKHGCFAATQGTTIAIQGSAAAPLGAAAATQGTAAFTQGTAGATHGIAAAPPGTAATTQGIATFTRGIAISTRGVAAATYALASWFPIRRAAGSPEQPSTAISNHSNSKSSWSYSSSHGENLRLSRLGS